MSRFPIQASTTFPRILYLFACFHRLIFPRPRSEETFTQLKVAWRHFLFISCSQSSTEKALLKAPLKTTAGPQSWAPGHLQWGTPTILLPSYPTLSHADAGTAISFLNQSPWKLEYDMAQLIGATLNCHLTRVKPTLQIKHWTETKAPTSCICFKQGAAHSPLALSCKRWLANAECLEKWNCQLVTHLKLQSCRDSPNSWKKKPKSQRRIMIWAITRIKGT